jgi:hypothetical protein
MRLLDLNARNVLQAVILPMLDQQAVLCVLLVSTLVQDPLAVRLAFLAIMDLKVLLVLSVLRGVIQL